MLVTSSINKAGESYALSHPGEDVQMPVANALLHALAALPEVDNEKTIFNTHTYIYIYINPGPLSPLYFI
jgi:hypothetical protein